MGAALPWLSRAVRFGQVKDAEFLLELRANVNQQDSEHEYSTPLMLAVSGKAVPGWKLSMCELLLAHGADVYARRQSDGKSIKDIFKENAKKCRSWARLSDALMVV